MFDASTRIGLGKREERGLVRTTILRRWGIPQTPRIIPVNAQNPGHDGGARLQPSGTTSGRHSNHRRAMLRRCSRSFSSPEAETPPGASVRPDPVLRHAQDEVL